MIKVQRVRKSVFYIFLAGIFWVSTLYAQLPPVFDRASTEKSQSVATTVRYLSPERILWQSENAADYIKNASRLLKKGNGQADLSNRDMCVMKSTWGIKPALLFDFGRELHGGLQIVTGIYPGQPVKLRIRFVSRQAKL